MIFTYNKEHVGDVLMVIVADGQGVKLAAERKGNVAYLSFGQWRNSCLEYFSGF